jgi:hypothetical protein
MTAAIGFDEAGSRDGLALGRMVMAAHGHTPLIVQKSGGGGARPAERKKPVIASQGGASEPPNTLPARQDWGAAAFRRTLATTICRVDDPTPVSRPRQLCDVSTVMRFRPAHQSMINRRHDGCASCLAR